MKNTSSEKAKENWWTKLKGLFYRDSTDSVYNSSEKKNSNPFLERTIENWLSSVNELGYQLPFCQLLISEGFRILHSSKHTAFEQGKDIIAIDKNDIPCAFQLKGGNITNTMWRDKTKGEIEELIDYTIVHPSVDKNKKHKSYLVTNGKLEDTVRVGIVNLNSDKWKGNPLQVIAGKELLRKFVELSGNFTPEQVSDYKSFLDLYFLGGRELIDEKKYAAFIKDVLQLDEDGLSKEERKRNIAAAVLYTSYIISSFKKENNHISIIQTLIFLCSHIFALVEKYKLNDKYWLGSFEIIWREIMNTGKLLEEEINNDGLVTLVNTIWDGEIAPYRRHLATSYLFAFKIAQLIEGNPKWNDIATNNFFIKLKESFKIWGEGALFPFILMLFYVKKASGNGDAIDYYRPLFSSLEVILKFNGRDSDIGILSPYYDITTAIKRKFGLLEEPIDEKFVGRSFIIKPIIDILARYGKRKELEDYWRDITYIAQESFIPDELWRHFLWRCNTGENKSEFPQQTQSWKALVDSANKFDLGLIPETIQRHPYFLPFFLLVYPHRINTNYIKFLDELVRKSK